MANFIQFGRPRSPSTTSLYMQLLSSLATDLDNMLSELYATSPPPYAHLSEPDDYNRQTSVDVQGGGAGGRVTLGHEGTLYNNNGNRVDAGAFASKAFHPNGPLTTGGNVKYSHQPSGSGLNLGAAHTKGFGTDFSATGNANIWRQGNSRLDAVGSYDKHFGGPGGTGRSGYYGGLQFQHRF